MYIWCISILNDKWWGGGKLLEYMHTEPTRPPSINWSGNEVRRSIRHDWGTDSSFLIMALSRKDKSNSISSSSPSSCTISLGLVNPPFTSFARPDSESGVDSVLFHSTSFAASGVSTKKPKTGTISNTKNVWRAPDLVVQWAWECDQQWANHASDPVQNNETIYYWIPWQRIYSPWSSWFYYGPAYIDIWLFAWWPGL